MEPVKIVEARTGGIGYRPSSHGPYKRTLSVFKSQIAKPQGKKVRLTRLSQVNLAIYNNCLRKEGTKITSERRKTKEPEEKDTLPECVISKDSPLSIMTWSLCLGVECGGIERASLVI